MSKWVWDIDRAMVSKMVFRLAQELDKTLF